MMPNNLLRNYAEFKLEFFFKWGTAKWDTDFDAKENRKITWNVDTIQNVVNKINDMLGNSELKEKFAYG